MKYRQQGGSDPLEDDNELCRRREDRWHTLCGMDVEAIFSQMISGDDSVLENAIITFIDTTLSLVRSSQQLYCDFEYMIYKTYSITTCIVLCDNQVIIVFESHPQPVM